MHKSVAIISDLYRLNIRSDPVVQHYEPKVICRICGHEGHSHLSCDYCTKKLGITCHLRIIISGHLLIPVTDLLVSHSRNMEDDENNSDIDASDIDDEKEEDVSHKTVY